jgi:hypothetical protein
MMIWCAMSDYSAIATSSTKATHPATSSPPTFCGGKPSESSSYVSSDGVA